MSKNTRRTSDTFVMMLGTSSYKRIYNDADALLRIARAKAESSYVHMSCIPRVSVLLYAVSMEAFANRVLLDIKELGEGRPIDERSPTIEKWKRIPLVHPKSTGKRFNTTSPNWEQFVELLKWRDTFVHPKAVVPTFSRTKKVGDKLWLEDFVRLSEVPEPTRSTMKLKLRSLATGPRLASVGLPNSPYEVVVEHAVKAKQVVDKMVRRLDEILAGRLTAMRFLEESDRMIAYYPDGKVDELEILRGLDVDPEVE